MKILVIGKNGQLAQAMSSLLSQEQVDFRAISQQELDICNIKSVEKLIEEFQPTVLINTSAYNLVELAEVEQEKAFLVNTIAVHNLARLCGEQDIQFVTYSTDYVFDGSSDKPYVETDKPNPLQIYGLSKLAGEIACHNANPRSYIIRTNGVYGGALGSPQKGGNFVLKIIAAAKENEVIEVANTSRVNPTYAVNLAEASWRMITNSLPGGTYHLASEGSCSWVECAKAIVEYMHLNATVKQVTKRTIPQAQRPSYSVLENTVAKGYAVVLPDWKTALTQYTNFLQQL